jgi:enoyl-CoA hydratase/carnithine racemase
VGKAIAMEMVLNNRTLSAAEALQYGLVNRVSGRALPGGGLLLAPRSPGAPLAVRLAKRPSTGLSIF